MVTLNVNGIERRYDGDIHMPLLWYLRDELGLTGTKFGCGQGPSRTGPKGWTRVPAASPE